MSVVAGLRSRRRWAGVVLVTAVLLTGLTVSAGACVAVGRGEQRYAGQLMDRYAEDVSEAVTDRVERYGETVTDLASAVGAQSNLRSGDFTRITAGLNATRLPGATGVAFVIAASTAQIADRQAWWRAHGESQLRLDPSAAAQHEFVVFERAFDDAASTQGLDLARSPQAVAALQTAQRSGALAISPAYQLLRDRNIAPAVRQTSVMLAAPVFTGLGSAAPEVFAGWIVMGVHGGDFLDQTLRNRSQGAVQVSLEDPAGAGTVIAAVSPGTRVRDETLERERTVTVGQRQWHLSMWPTTRLLSATNRRMSALTLGAGIALTLMLAVMTGVLAGSRNRALDQVDRATTDLRDDINRRKLVENRLREREAELQHLAFHDPLTGLANRILFYDRVAHALTTHERGGSSFAVLFIDLDGFKQVNDQHGHSAGDTVLCEVAARLRHGLRASDTVTRFGGDEFAVIIEQLTTPTDARTTAERIVAAVQQPIDVNGQHATVTASVGIAANRPGDTADDILREADLAMYQAKTSGKSRYVEASTPQT